MKNEKINSKIKLSNNSSFVISIFVILKFRNIGRSKFWPPPSPFVNVIEIWGRLSAWCTWASLFLRLNGFIYLHICMLCVKCWVTWNFSTSRYDWSTKIVYNKRIKIIFKWIFSVEILKVIIEFNIIVFNFFLTCLITSLFMYTFKFEFESSVSAKILTLTRREFYGNFYHT